MIRYVLLTAAAVLAFASAANAEPAKADLDKAPAAASSISPGEIAFGNAMNACFKKSTPGDCYVVELKGHLVGYCPIHGRPGNEAVLKGCSDEANAAVSPKKWTGN